MNFFLMLYKEQAKWHFRLSATLVYLFVQLGVVICCCWSLSFPFVSCNKIYVKTLAVLSKEKENPLSLSLTFLFDNILIYFLYSQLESFKRHLMQSLRDDSSSVCSSFLPSISRYLCVLANLFTQFISMFIYFMTVHP